MKLIVGLGNPGAKYQFTRHNAGFIFVDCLSKSLGSELNEKRFDGLVGKTSVFGHDSLILKPQTFMNLSGRSVRQCLSFFKIPLEDMVVIYDDVDLEPGRVKARFKGGSGGHNGIRSIVSETGSDTFHRIKLGVGKPSNLGRSEDVASWVLSAFSEEELNRLRTEMYDQAMDRIEQIFKQVNSRKNSNNEERD